MTLSIMTSNIATLAMMTSNIMTLSITALSIMTFSITINKNDTLSLMTISIMAEHCHAECHITLFCQMSVW